MATNFKLDHIAIMVSDLSAAMQNYKTLGFTVLEGGVHEANPTHNALIVFADGVYLEIIALRPGATAPMSTRLQKWHQASPGLVDFALLPADIEADIASARSRGLDIEDAAPGGRQRPDGQEIVWKTANLPGSGLPFFCADVTPRSLRVQEGTVRQHPNGALGVKDLNIAVFNLETSTRLYEALLGFGPQLGANKNTFFLGETSITLSQPEHETDPLHAYLQAGGERPYSLTLKAKETKRPRDLDLKLAHQARIKI